MDRDDFRGRAIVGPILTASVSGISHRPVGTAAGWTLHFDEPESLRLTGHASSPLAQFQGQGRRPLAKQFPDVTHLVWFGEALPEVWLNSAFDDLRSLLDDRKRPGAEKGLHDMQRLSIARGVWMALVADALAAVREQTEEAGETEPEWPDTEWQSEVLRRVLPEIAPGSPTVSY